LWSAFWIIINVVAGLTGLGTGPGIQLVAWEAHIGGYFAGLLLAGPADWLRRRELGRKQPGTAA
jgi:membrane associated rhomboid family serine protease